MSNTWSGRSSKPASTSASNVHRRWRSPTCRVSTGLTEDGGDEVAAELAGRLTELVGTATHHGGQAVKFLGDGVMFHFKDPGKGVEAVLDIVERTVSAGLPPAHVGMHAGPVVLREGDYERDRGSGRALPPGSGELTRSFVT